MKPAAYPLTYEVVVQDGSITKRMHEFRCSEPGCNARLHIPILAKRRPPEVIIKMAKNKGWEIDVSKKISRCPEHNKENPMSKQTAPEEARISTELRQPTREQRRAIFREIDENYDGRAYVLGASDKSIAEKLKVPWAWVAAIREENFGPPGLDPELQAAIKKIEGLEAKVKQMETDAIRAFEESAKQISVVAEQLKSVRTIIDKFKV
jgi:hypothetical protein